MRLARENARKMDLGGVSDAVDEKYTEKSSRVTAPLERSGHRIARIRLNVGKIKSLLDRHRRGEDLRYWRNLQQECWAVVNELELD